MGFEPMTPTLRTWCSSQLSYYPVQNCADPTRDRSRGEKWWLLPDLNQRPMDYDSSALPTELSSHDHSATLTNLHFLFFFSRGKTKKNAFLLLRAGEERSVPWKSLPEKQKFTESAERKGEGGRSLSRLPGGASGKKCKFFRNPA